MNENLEFQKFPFITKWNQILCRNLPPEKAQTILLRANQIYQNLLTNFPLHTHIILRKHQLKILIPAHAVYVAAREIQSTQIAYPLVKDFYSELLSPLRKILQYIARIPFSGFLFRLMISPVIRIAFPIEGWNLSWSTRNKEESSFCIHDCIYLKTLTRLGTPDLTSIFCWLDEFMFQDLAPRIHFSREHTLALDNKPCSFKFRY